MEWDKLLNPQLLAYCTMFVLFLQFLDNKAAESKLLEGWRWLPKIAIGFAFSFFIASIWRKYLAPEAPHDLSTDWVLQGVVGGVWMALWNGVSQAAYGPGRPPSSPEDLRSYVAKSDPQLRAQAGIRMDHPDRLPPNVPSSNLPGGVGLLLLVIALSVALAGIAEAAHTHIVMRNGAQVVEPDSNLWALWRFSGGLSAGGVIVDSDHRASQTSEAIGNAYLSYTLTDRLSLAGNIEAIPRGSMAWGTAGARLALFTAGEGGNPMQLGLGIDRVWWNDKARVFLSGEGPPIPPQGVFWSLRASESVARYHDQSTALWLAATARWCPEANTKLYTASLRWQGFGGR